MQAFDASSIVHAWDNYPPIQFPGLWQWLSEQIKNQNIVMSIIALKEVGEVSPECAAWLTDSNISILHMTNTTLQEALRIKNLLGIVGDKFGKGVDEKDLFIIASACENQRRLISNEAVQAKKPDLMHNYKIPAVCALPTVKVECIDFLEFIKQSNIVFG